MATENEKKFYSREELREFEAIIQKKLEEAQKEQKRLADSLKESGGDSADGFSISDFGSETRDREQTEMLMARQEKFMLNLHNALSRIKNGTYGICKVTGKLISKERLRVVPHTTTSIEAKRQQSNKGPRNRG